MAYSREASWGEMNGANGTRPGKDPEPSGELQVPRVETGLESGPMPDQDEEGGVDPGKGEEAPEPGNPEKPTGAGPQAKPEEIEAPPRAGTMLGGPLEREPRGQGHVMAEGEGRAPGPVGLGKTAEPRLDAKTRETGTQTGPEPAPELRWGTPSKSRGEQDAPNKGEGH